MHNYNLRFQYSSPEFDRTCKQKINKSIEELNITINQLDLIDMYRAFHSTIAEYTLFQMHMEYFQICTIYMFLKQVSINVKGLK